MSDKNDKTTVPHPNKLPRNFFDPGFAAEPRDTIAPLATGDSTALLPGLLASAKHELAIEAEPAGLRPVLRTRATGAAIPPDEPVFCLLGRDGLAVDVLAHYLECVIACIRNLMEEFYDLRDDERAVVEKTRAAIIDEIRMLEVHQDAVESVIESFERFQRRNPDRLHTPTT